MCSSSRARRRFPSPELKSKYLALLKAQEKTFGYIVRGVRGTGGAAGAGPVIDQMVKVTLDGQEEPVRGLRFGTVPPTAFRDLSEASQERTVYNYRGSLTSAVSVIAPSLIFEELEDAADARHRAEAARSYPLLLKVRSAKFKVKS